MYYRIVPYSIAELVTAVIAFIVAVFAWHRRSAPSGIQLVLLMAAIFEWALCDFFEAAAVEQATKIFWSQVGYIGAHTAPAFLLLFALRYSQDDKWLSPG